MFCNLVPLNFLSIIWINPAAEMSYHILSEFFNLPPSKSWRIPTIFLKLFITIPAHPHFAISVATTPWTLKWSEVPWSCLILCNATDSNLPGSSVHAIFQARVLEWVAISFSTLNLKPYFFLIVLPVDISVRLVLCVVLNSTNMCT